jgi:hypothetical protein
MPPPHRSTSHKPVWIGFLISLLLHLGIGFWLGELWQQEEEEEAFRTRLTYFQTKLKAKRLETVSTQEMTQVTSQMEYLDSEAVPTEIQESHLEPLPASLPSTEAPDAPTSLEEFSVGSKSAAPVLAQEKMVSPGQIGLADSAGHAAMDLLRLEDMARANKEHALVIPDQTTRRDLSGYINFTRLRVYGAGSGSAGSLDALARYLRDYTQLLAQVRDQTYQYFLSEQLLKDPIHFIIQGGGLPSYDLEHLTRFSDEEYALLDRYLRSGGFLFIEGDNRFLREMIDHMKKVLGSEGNVFELPLSHPIYQSYYSFESGFSGENKQRVKEAEERSWYYPLSNPRELFEAQNAALTVNDPTLRIEGGGPDYLGLYGVELNGDLVAVISDLQMSSKWAGIAAVEDEEADDVLPPLMAATNIAIYALIRPGGLTAKLDQPIWVEQRPDFIPQTTLQRRTEADFADRELFAELDAYIALVQSPLGSKIDKNGLKIRLDGRYSLSLLKSDLHGLLLHNLPTGKHWLELYYGGKSKHLEVDLQGGEVLTLTFALNRLVFFTQLRLSQLEEKVGIEEWVESFTDLQIEDIYLDEERNVLDSAAKF